MDGTFFRRQLSLHWVMQLAATKDISRKALERAMAAKAAWERREQSFRAYDRTLIDILISQVKGVRAKASITVGKKAAKQYGAHVHTFPRELAGAFTDTGRLTFAISGSPGDIVRPFAAQLGIHDIRASEFVVGPDGCFTGEIQQDWISRKNKGDAIQDLANTYNIDLKESVAIGDTLSDVEMMKCVGYPICYNANPQMTEAVERRRWPMVIERAGSWTILTWYGHAQHYMRIMNAASILPYDIRRSFLARATALHNEPKPAP